MEVLCRVGLGYYEGWVEVYYSGVWVLFRASQRSYIGWGGNSYEGGVKAL